MARARTDPRKPADDAQEDADAETADAAVEALLERERRAQRVGRWDAECILHSGRRVRVAHVVERARHHVAGGSGREEGDGPIHKISDKAWDYTISINLDSIFYSNRAVIQQLMNQGTGGTILNMSSVLGFSPSSKFFSTHAYASTKAAIVGLSKSLASYYSKYNIRINVISPGLIATPMSKRAQSNKNILSYIKQKQSLDGGRIGEAIDLDGAATYFMSDKSSFTTGQVLSIDGGWSVNG